MLQRMPYNTLLVATLILTLSTACSNPSSPGPQTVTPPRPPDSSLSATPKHTGNPSGKSIRSVITPDYIINDYEIRPFAGYSFLEMPTPDGHPAELHIFTEAGAARHKYVFIYEQQRLVRQIEFTFQTADDRVRTKDYTWKGDTATYTEKRYEEQLVLNPQGLISERWVKGTATLPIAYLHLIYDQQHRVATSARFLEEAGEYRILQTRYKYSDHTASPWLSRETWVLDQRLKPKTFKNWTDWKTAIQTFPSDFEARAFKQTETRTLE